MGQLEELVVLELKPALISLACFQPSSASYCSRVFVATVRVRTCKIERASRTEAQGHPCAEFKGDPSLPWHTFIQKITLQPQTHTPARPHTHSGLSKMSARVVHMARPCMLVCLHTGMRVNVPTDSGACAWMAGAALCTVTAEYWAGWGESGA